MNKPERIIVGQFENPSPQFTMYTKPKLKKTFAQKIALAVIPFAIIFANIVSEVGYDLAEEEHTFSEPERIETHDSMGFNNPSSHEETLKFSVYVIPGDFDEMEIKGRGYGSCRIYDYDLPSGEGQWERHGCWELNSKIFVRYVGDTVEVAVSGEPREIEYKIENQFISDGTDIALALLWLAIPGSVIAYFYLGKMNKERYA